MNVALVLTVKDEERLLKQNIYYHLGIGIKKIYIYFDGTEDGGRELVEDIDGVECLDSIISGKFEHLPFLEKFNASRLQQHTARQCLNSYDAEQRCVIEGLDWLISIDADEFFVTSDAAIQSVDDFFENIQSDGYTLIRLGVREVIPRRMAYNHVALEETLFKSKKNFSSRFDQIYFKIFDPYTNTSIQTSYWLSHNMGKCAIKVGTDLIPHNVHKYKPRNENTPAKTIHAGFILHYFQYDLDDFIKKSVNFKFIPKHYLSGKRIGRLKELYITLVNDPDKTRAEIFEFYEKNLLFNEKKVKRLRKTSLLNLLPRQEDAIIEIRKPSEILERYKHLL